MLYYFDFFIYFFYDMGTWRDFRRRNKAGSDSAREIPNAIQRGQVVDPSRDPFVKP